RRSGRQPFALRNRTNRWTRAAGARNFGWRISNCELNEIAPPRQLRRSAFLSMLIRTRKLTRFLCFFSCCYASANAQSWHRFSPRRELIIELPQRPRRSNPENTVPSLFLTLSQASLTRLTYCRAINLNFSLARSLSPNGSATADLT